MQICNLRMNCGHSCEKYCHDFEITSKDTSGHDNIQCLKPCARERICGHTCPRKCYLCKKGHIDDCEVKVKK